MVLVALALGSNLGDRLANLGLAVAKLVAAGAISEVRVSSAFETTPVECVDGAPGFLNAALVGETSLAPLELLTACQRIEEEMGRAAVRKKNADRTIDLYLLLVGDCVVDTAELTLPHPAMHERDFVMVPLAELLPEVLVGPDKLPVKEVAGTTVIQSIVAGAPQLPIDWQRPVA